MGWKIVTKFQSLFAGRGAGRAVGKLAAMVANVENTNGRQLIATMRGLTSDLAIFFQKTSTRLRFVFFGDFLILINKCYPVMRCIRTKARKGEAC